MKLCGFDVETASAVNQEFALQPWRAKAGDAVIRSFAAVWGDKPEDRQAVLDPTKEVLQDRLRRCKADGQTMVAWNAPFDLAWLLAYDLYEEVFALNWLDGELLWRHMCVEPEPEERRKKSFGLKAAVAEFLPKFAGYEEGVEFDTTTEEGLRKLLHYNTLDSLFTRRLAMFFWSMLTPEQQRCAWIEASCLPQIAQATLLGMRINTNKAKALDLVLEQRQQTAYAQLIDLAPEIAEVDLGSPKQLAKLLFEDWGLPVHKRTEKGAPSTDKEALAYIGDYDVRGKLLRENRDAIVLRTKFVQRPLQSLEYNESSTTHPQARVFGTYTGRLTYSSKQGRGKNERPTGVALHQWKRDKAFRELIEPPVGYDIIEYDFSGQEYRWMGVLSGDETILAMCQPGEDGHCFMGARIAHREYHEMLAAVRAEDAEAKKYRQGGKVSNLSLQYRMSWRTLIVSAKIQYGLTLTEEEAQHYHAMYPATYVKVPEYWDSSIALARYNGYAETVAGRRVQLKGPWRGRAAYAQEQTAINFRIQGTGADQKYLAMLILKNELPKYNGHFYFDLHDGLYSIVPKGKAEKAFWELKPKISALPYKKAWGVDLPIAFPVDGKLGPSWGELKELK